MKLNNIDTTKPLSHAAHEEEVLTYWDETKAFERSISERSADKSYVFYDGPPFATGLPHYGHLLASTAKDVVPRYWTMKGYRVERTWGWDCHGVPIENMIEGELDSKVAKKGIEEP
jgi:isoleucyl-tRNA synthetase